jgi:hypothetical protein
MQAPPAAALAANPGRRWSRALIVAMLVTSILTIVAGSAGARERSTGQPGVGVVPSPVIQASPAPFAELERHAPTR